LRLVLASASPRRQALIALLDIPWRASPVEVDEAAQLLDDPLASAINVAVAKLRALGASADDCVIAADTLVVLDGRVLGKPADADEATSMLRGLRDRTHDVLTGVALSRNGQTWAAVVSTRVAMRAYSDAEVEVYVARGEPFDKAGGYAIQDAVFKPVARVDGCYLNVVGLPLCAVAAGLRTLDAEVQPAGPPPCHYCRAGASIVSIP
jgi:septum formation protein